ncbi:MAG: hypothetical protein HZB54_07810 [Deltaproteobacteria bacterium]|nr:hypothetical protein [Deltaproteobacteria bacterium]
MISDKNMIGHVYRCHICGAEVSVIKGSNGRLKPVCCNTEMIMLKTINAVYVCSVCFSEIMVIKDNTKNLQPSCCNNKMKIRLHRLRINIYHV